MLYQLFLQATTAAPAGGTAAPAGGAGGGGGSSLNMLFMMGAIVVVFYFFMIRPQQKKAKAERAFREGLSKGDKIMTLGGIYGKIASTDESDGTILIEVDNNVKLRVDKSSVRAIPATPEAKK
jgi:preprotein translocase subunit YajC